MPRPRRRLSALARQDIRGIARTSRALWGKERADRYNRSLNAAFDHLAAYPEIGSERPDIGDDIMLFTIERHYVLYRVQPDGVLIVRVIHQRMDLGRIALT